MSCFLLQLFLKFALTRLHRRRQRYIADNLDRVLDLELCLQYDHSITEPFFDFSWRLLKSLSINDIELILGPNLLITEFLNFKTFKLIDESLFANSTTKFKLDKQIYIFFRKQLFRYFKILNSTNKYPRNDRAKQELIFWVVENI